jgi:hypothetical protein
MHKKFLKDVGCAGPTDDIKRILPFRENLHLMPLDSPNLYSGTFYRFATVFPRTLQKSP